MPLNRLFFFFLILLTSYSFGRANEYETFSENGKYGLKNVTSGDVIIPPQYESIGWSDGSFKIINNSIGARQNEKWALIDIQGGKISLHEYSDLLPFASNLFIVSKRDQNSILAVYGVINNRAKYVIEPSYSKLEPFNDLLIASQRQGPNYQFGLLNKTGKAIIPLIYKRVEPIEKGYISVTNNDNLTAIYRDNGSSVTGFNFEDVSSLTDQFFLIKRYNKRGLLDKTGNIIVSPIYKNIQMSGQKIRALPFKKWDLYEANSFKRSYYFDRMQIVDQNTFATSSGGQTGLIDLEENYKEYLTNLTVLTSSNGLTIVEDVQSGYQGVIDIKGKLILSANYDSIVIVDQLIFGQIKSIDRQDWAVFNQSGNRQNPFSFESFEKMKDGLIKARRNGKVGLLQPNGKDQSPFNYDNIGEFKNGLSVVSYLGSVGVIDTNGNWVITPYNDQIDILESVILVQQGSEWKLVGFDGIEKVRSYNELAPLTRGYTALTKDGYELYSPQDSLWFKHTYDTVQRISPELYGLKRDGRFFLFNPNSETAYPLDRGIAELGQLAESLIPVFKDDQWGQINTQGKLRIANRYEAIGPFSEGLAAARLIGKWGYIDINENIIVQPIYDSVSAFHKGLSTVMRDGLYGIMDKQGKLVLEHKFTSINRQDDYMILNSNGLFGLAGPSGKLIRTPQYDRISALQNGNFLIERDGLKGVVNLKGQDVVPLSYEAIEQSGNRFLASEPSTWQLISIK